MIRPSPCLRMIGRTALQARRPHEIGFVLLANQIERNILDRTQTAELGVRLIQRSTRRLQITEIGQRFYERCRMVVAESENAKRIIEDARGVPRGRVRVSCPTNFSQIFLPQAQSSVLWPTIHTLMSRWTQPTETSMFSRRIRSCFSCRHEYKVIEPELCVRWLVTRHWLLASPTLIARCGAPRGPDDLKNSVGGIFPVEYGGPTFVASGGSQGPETDNCLSSTLS